MKILVNIVPLILFSIISLSGQTSALFYSKIAQAYEKENMKIILSGRMSFTDENLNKNISGLIYKTKKQYYSSFMNKEIIQSGDKYVYADHTNKIIICKEAGWMNMKKELMPIISDSSYLSRYNFNSSVSKGIIHIEITPKKESEYKSIKLDVNKSSFLITRIHYTFNSNDNLIREFELNYNYVSIKKEDDDLFNYSRFIIEKPSIKLQPKYSTYKLLNDYDQN